MVLYLFLDGNLMGAMASLHYKRLGIPFQGMHRPLESMNHLRLRTSKPVLSHMVATSHRRLFIFK